MPDTPKAFLSYAHADDEFLGGQITALRDAIQRAVRFETGEPFEVFLDRDDIGLGQDWQDRLDEGLAGARLLIPILSPSYFASGARRAGTTTPFWTGATISTDLANYDGNYTYGDGKKGAYRKKTVRVDDPSFPANRFGLHHMHGNVWEWCEDCWHGDYAGAPTDGSAWTTNCASSARVVRGGSWVNDPGNLRSASRYGVGPDDRYNNTGFRVARMLTP
jgi:hypothetical protein